MQAATGWSNRYHCDIPQREMSSSMVSGQTIRNSVPIALTELRASLSHQPISSPLDALNSLLREGSQPPSQGAPTALAAPADGHHAPLGLPSPPPPISSGGPPSG